MSLGMALSVGKYTSTKGAISIYVCSPKNTHNWMELPFTDFHMDHKFMGPKKRLHSQVSRNLQPYWGDFLKGGEPENLDIFSSPYFLFHKMFFKNATQKNNLLIPIVPSRRTNIAPENRSSQKARWSPNQHVSGAMISFSGMKPPTRHHKDATTFL